MKFELLNKLIDIDQNHLDINLQNQRKKFVEYVLIPPQIENEFTERNIEEQGLPFSASSMNNFEWQPKKGVLRRKFFKQEVIF